MRGLEMTEDQVSTEDALKVLRQRFWILSAILVVANCLFAFGGKQLVEYKFQDYMDQKLKTWNEKIETAQANASGAISNANTASTTATEAFRDATVANTKATEADSKADTLQTRLNTFDEQLEELSDLQGQIDEAKQKLGEYQQLVSRIADLEGSLNRVVTRTRLLSVENGKTLVKGTLLIEDDNGSNRLSLRNFGNISEIKTDKAGEEGDGIVRVVRLND